MTKSRRAPGRWLLLAAASAGAPLPAQTIDADALISTQHAELRQTLRLDCPPATDDEEIVICGSRDEQERYRLPPTQGPARSADRAGGEQRAALAVDSSRCAAVGPNQQCTRGLDMIIIGPAAPAGAGIGFAVAHAVAQVIANRD
ncbi:MAG: hypothetical protein ACXWUP_03050 [Allosphingosinicella sp.]